ncbi:hypothetical protein EV586_101101 [Tumebacillus sp. BK434]|nr:hypothetical protein EV586_101101 [Tumebacillus sp. BK434]
MPPSLWFTANWIGVLTILATVGVLVWLMAYRRKSKRR